MISLGEKAAQNGFRLSHVEKIDSTSAALMKDALAGATGPQWLVADEQEDGKGRRGRFWNSPKGNLYASLLLTDPAPSEKIAQLSFVMALALRDAVVAINEPGVGPTDDDIEVKWPNDLILCDKKCAGLLLEGGVKGQSRFVVVGLGVNVLSHPEKANHPAGNLNEWGIHTSVEHFFPYLSDAVALRLEQWAMGQGFSATRQDWLAHAYKVGQDMRINTSTESFVARLNGVDETGNLMVDQMGRPRTITAGEIFPLDMNFESNN
ncbi:biotin--[acetyl-CoA-carboxylase] ligase [Maritalea porphyrae]|uniref:biotin--[acetyl-CoA-carboxylase] ligase n=1 Tax=Maritalea porphyrae TaxID=880732 RepID=UPI0022AF9AA2|nr:biotin--[acetyl-CoA-carboxylase] ligase [Maritalea porphyrae]MCZ4273022.1 biotin--[acetyl-CoA-carboxylase] ligase [Maritalea porphyrae]